MMIQTIKDRIRLEELIGETMTIEGRGRLLSTQEHDSLKIRTDWQRWFWYSKGDAQGDIFDWYMMQHRCDFRTALEALAAKAGVELEPLTPAQQQAQDERRSRAAVLRIAAAFYHAVLTDHPEAEPARRYCYEERNWTAATVVREQIGYVLPADKALLPVEGFQPLHARLRAAELLDHPAAKAVLSIPAGMIVYAHRDRGQVVYLSGRSIEGKRHYNLPEELAGAKQPYVNDPETIKGGAHVLVEGQADAIALAQLGIQATAVCGLSDLAIKVSHVAFDNDKAGKAKALDVALNIDPLCRVVTWPKSLRHRLDNHNYVDIKDAADLLKAKDDEVTLAAWLEDSPQALQELAALAGKAKDDDRQSLMDRFFQLYCGLDEMVATDMLPDLAIRIGQGVSQFKRLLKAYENSHDSEDDKFSERHVISAGSYVGGHLFEQCVRRNDVGDLITYYWVRNPEGNCEKRDAIKIGNTMYWPVDPREEELIIGGDVLFAEDRVESGNEVQLLKDIRAFIHRWLDVPAYYENIASYYVLLTWFYDAGFETLPYLRALGDFGSGKSRFLNTIGQICFRPMLFGGGDSEATIYYTMETFKGTMIIDESDFEKSDESALIAKIINMGNNRRGAIKRMETKPSGGYKVKRFNVFGPKIFGARNGFGDLASDSRCLTHYTSKGLLRPDIPIDLTSEFYEESQRLRNRLLDYRLKHWQPVEIDPSQTDRTIMPRLAQITLALKSIISDQAILDELQRFILLYNQSLVNDRQTTDPAIVVEAMVRIRYPKPAVVEVEPNWELKNIAAIATEVMKDFDPDESMTPKRVGGILGKQLGIIRRETTSQNTTKIIVDDDELEGLMHRYGIKRPHWAEK